MTSTGLSRSLELQVRAPPRNPSSPGRAIRSGLFGVYGPHSDSDYRFFDLHKVPPRNVKAVVEEYLLEAHRLGLKALRIIHGRGVGVQREMVRPFWRGRSSSPITAMPPRKPAVAGAAIVTLR